MTSKKAIPKHERGTAAIAALIPAPYNPRRIDKAAKKALGKSLERFGVVQDVVVNRRTGHIVGGHQRVEALRDAGETEVPVVWVDLNDSDEKALNVVLNSDAVSGEYDEDKLRALLEELPAIGDDFAELRLDKLLEELPAVPAPDDDDEGGEGKPPKTPHGKKVVTMNAEQWAVFERARAKLAGTGPLEQGEAVAELAERYLASLKRGAA